MVQPKEAVVRSISFLLLAVTFGLLPFTALGQGSNDGPSNAELAKKVNNPLSDLITIPFQVEYDSGYGPSDGESVTLSLQPVVPFSLGENYSLVTRTILPITWQRNVFGPSGEQFGLGDMQQSFFLSPKPQSTSIGDLTFGVGPVVTWPTSTDRLLGLGTLGLGPTGVFVVQDSKWTYGALVSHQWGVAETRSNVPDLNETFFEPFIAYTTKDQWTFSLFTEAAYDWTSKEWSLPIKANVGKLVRLGRLPLELQAGATYWADSETGGPNGVGVRGQVTVILPSAILSRLHKSPD